MASPSTQTLLLPAYPHPIPLVQARHDLPGPEFRARLREAMLATPTIKLSQVASALGVSRQYVGALVGKLDRPNCAHPNRPAPKREAARAALAQLEARVAQGESAAVVVKDLGLSINVVVKMGFRVHDVRPNHGTAARAQAGCHCWRCRRASGAALFRGRPANAAQRAATLDWLAWRDPDDDSALTQARIGDLVGIGQPVVSRIAKNS